MTDNSRLSHVELPRNERAQRVQRLVGPKDLTMQPMVGALRAMTGRSFERHVLPLARRHWPELLSDPFYAKLHIAVCDLYAAAPYTVLLCSKQAPTPLRLTMLAADRLGLPPKMLAHASTKMLWALERFGVSKHRRIVLVASLIAVIDHAFDHGMSEAPKERGARLHALLDGKAVAPAGMLTLTQALLHEAQRDLLPKERVHFESARKQLHAWVDAEVLGLIGDADASGLGHRLAGIEGTIDGLLFPIASWVGDEVRQWMYEVSLFVQMLDDYLDYDDDLDQGRNTPFMTGDWTFDKVEKTWEATCLGMETLCQQAGLNGPHVAGSFRRAYSSMMRDIVDAMVSGIAA